MTKNILMLAAAILVFQAAPVLADNHGDGKGKMFEKHDTNGDGSISKDEFLTHAEERFSTMDANGDGSISQDEAQSARKDMREKMKDKREKWKERKSEATDSE